MSKNPFKRNNPYANKVHPAKVIANQVTSVGFLDTLRGDFDKLSKDIKSVEARLKYRYDKGVPAAYVGERVFAPSTSEVDLDIFSDGAPAEPVNVVVPSGQAFNIPVVLQGPGVFVARSLTVTLYQRYYKSDTSQEVWCPLPYTRSFYDVQENSSQGTDVQTIKWSLMYDLAALAQLVYTPTNERLFGTNFFWNLEDASSERSIADDLLPAACLNAQGWEKQANGGIYYLETPWLFERATTLNFKMQVINDILQLAATSAVFPVNGVDDRENGGTVRNQSVKARVELHGTKFYNERDDLLREAT